MASFLGNLGGKAAHSPRFSIGGSADLKPLQALLNTEKAVLTTTTKLSTETKRAGDALRDYGANEGDDLRDVLGKVALLFDQLSRAQLVFTEHEETYRAHFKSVRAREEAYAQLRKTNDSLAGKIDSAERTLAKTSQEHKERETRERKLYELRQEKIGLENAVAKEDAELYDHKREVTRMALSLRELSEKGTVIAEMAKLLIAEIPRDRTPIGGAHPMYYGDQDTDKVMREAERCLSAVTFNPRADLMPASPTAPGQGTFTSVMSGRDSAANGSLPTSPTRRTNRASMGPDSSYQLQPAAAVAESGMTADDAYDAYFNGGSPAAPTVGTFETAPGGASAARTEENGTGYHPSPLSKAYSAANSHQLGAPINDAEAPSSSLPYTAESVATEPAPRQSTELPSAPIAAANSSKPPSVTNSAGSRTRAPAPAVAPIPEPVRQTSYDHGSSTSWERANGVTVAPVTTPIARPNYARGDSALGSRHGFDSSAYGGPNPLPAGDGRYPTMPTSSSQPQLAQSAGPMPYSYHAAQPPLPPNSRMMSAGAFRGGRSQGAQPQAPPNMMAGDGPSPAALIREAYLAQSQGAPPQGASPASPVLGEATQPLRLHKRTETPDATQQPSIPVDGWQPPPAYGQPPAEPSSGPSRVPAAPVSHTEPAGMTYVTRLD